MLASAIENCNAARFDDQVGDYTSNGSVAKRVAHLIPPGSRVLLELLRVPARGEPHVEPEQTA